MHSFVNVGMKPSKSVITRILRARACHSRTTRCPCPSTTRFSSTAQSAAAADEISSSDLSSVEKRQAGASWRIPQQLIREGRESVRGESLPWGSLCLAAAGIAAAAQSLDSTRGNQVVSAAAAAAAAAAATTTTTNQASASNAVQELPVRRHAVADAVEHASPWVVNVVATMSHEHAKGFDAKTHMGSGFVVSEDGLVVTNAHVVEGCLNGAVAVNFTGGEQLQGKVQAMDRRFDLALVKVDVPPGLRLPVADIGRSLNLRAGEFVVAMGSPKGLANTCTLGIISTTARPRSDLVDDEQTAKITSDSSDFIQTDAAVATGNSGGPLIDLDGRVVGINTLKLSNTEGVGFAIPIDTAWQVIEALRTRGRVDRPQLGMRMVTADIQRSNGTKGGVMILNVTPGGPADRAGLRLGDFITEFDGKEVASTCEILQLIGNQVGREIGMTIQRGVEKTLRITVVTESDVKVQGGGDDKSSAPKTPGTGKPERFKLEKEGDPGTFTISAEA